MKGLIISIAAAALLLTTAIAGYSLTSNDGSTIYNTDCALCHGAMDSLSLTNSTTALVLSTNAGRITSAFRHHTSMRNSILQTNVGVIGAGPQGQLTAKQKKALVAALQIQHGEDLYNAKFANSPTTDCSFCHGPYDNTPLAGSTNFNKIVRSFRQNKLKNNMMTPLRSKYKLTELHLIAKALAVAPPFSNSTSGGGGTPTATDGATLYYEDCMNCHNGPISVVDTTSPDIAAVYNAGSNGATVIQDAINNSANNMNSTTLLSLSPAQIQAIATAIQTDAQPDPSLYSSLTCSPCHNPDGSLKPGA